LSQSDYNLISDRFDRGHMVRREDPQWGTAQTALRAMDDTFHFVNACPQNWQFNQSPSFWQGIENYVLDGMKEAPERVSVFTGPVFAQNDPLYSGIKAPVRFWKIVARIVDGKVRATGFVASQRDIIDQKRRGAEETLGREWPIEPDEPVAGFQATISKIQ